MPGYQELRGGSAEGGGEERGVTEAGGVVVAAMLSAGALVGVTCLDVGASADALVGVRGLDDKVSSVVVLSPAPGTTGSSSARLLNASSGGMYFLQSGPCRPFLILQALQQCVPDSTK